MAFTREDAEKKCMDLGGKQYLEVKWRMVWFREQCPKGTIDTEEVAYDLDREVAVELFRWEDDPVRLGKKRKVAYTKTAKGYARYRAIVTDGNGARATGTKSECAANFPDFGEKAETGAIGRALAALGYGTQFTGDELDEGKRIVDSPVQASNGQALHNLTAPGSYEQHEAAQEQANSDISPAIQRMIDIAKHRAEKLGVSWETVKKEARVNFPDTKLVASSFVHINGWITQQEKAESKGVGK